MEISKFWDLKTLIVSNEALVAQVIGNKCLPNRGIHQAVRAQVVYTHCLDTHSKKQEDKQFIKEWLYSIDSADQQNGTKWNLATNSDRCKRLKARVSIAFSRHAHLGFDKSEWALASVLPYIIFSWRPICGVDPTPVGEDERKDVCIEDSASAFGMNDQVRAAIRAILDKKDWMPAIKVGNKLTQQMDVGPAWPSLESNVFSEGHTRC
ncbi:hypothetical protein Plhal304r1_c031g0101601 [Plasmopara halstedii]